jgi:S-DNA-T family DNA segregation ATPase FtsK/SpoIIIE
MKPIRIVLIPTRSRPLNIFLGLVMLLVSVLLFLALATYRPTDPSLNTAADLAARNWIGLCGAWLSDLLLQSLGITAFFLPLLLGGIGWSWMRSRSGGSPLLRWLGAILAFTFVPAVFALLPWRWLWLHALPVEGVIGHLVSAQLVRYLNLQGAWIVAGVLALAGLYFASAVSIWALREGVQDRWIHVQAWRDRWRNWREERAERREDSDEEEDEPARPGRIAGLFHRRGRDSGQDTLDEIPAFQRAPLEPQEAEIPVTARVQKPSIWEQIGRASCRERVEVLG